MRVARCGRRGWVRSAIAFLALPGRPAFAMGDRGDDFLPPPFEIYGHGSETVGGRNGSVYRVTSLSGGSGRGTLRDAVSRPNRYVVFDVSGTIHMPGNLALDQPNVTVDGSTAPNGGVQFKGTGQWTVEADEIILRHLRFRPGADPTGKLLSRDCLTIVNGTNIVLDHISCTWGTDENVSMYGRRKGHVDRVRNVTIQHSLIAEALQCPRVARPGCLRSGHSMGSLFEGDLDNITLYRNLYAHNVDRNPLVTTGRRGPGQLLQGQTRLLFAQNVVYDYIYALRLAARSPSWHLKVDAINNLFKWGRDYRRFGTAPKVPIERLLAQPGRDRGHRGRLSLHLRDNIAPRRKAGDPDCMVFQVDSANLPCGGDSKPPLRDLSPEPVSRASSSSPDPPSLSAADLEAAIAKEVGATLPCRDAVDARIVADMRAGTGSWIDDPEDVGGWPDLTRPCGRSNVR